MAQELYDKLKSKLKATGLSSEDKHMWLGVLENATQEQVEAFMYYLNDGLDTLGDMTELMRLKLEQLDDDSKSEEIISLEEARI